MQAWLVGAIEMHFAEDRGLVSGFPEGLRQRRTSDGKRRRQPGHSSGVRQHSGQEGLGRGGASGRVAKTPPKPKPPGGEPVEMGSRSEPVAIRSQYVTGMIVGE